MDFISLLKALIEAGVLVVIASIFLMQQSKLFSKQEQLIEVLAKLERNLNNDTRKGKALELCLLLKIQEMRWGIQNRLINYIERNHLFSINQNHQESVSKRILKRKATVMS